MLSKILCQTHAMPQQATNFSKNRRFVQYKALQAPCKCAALPTPPAGLITFPSVFCVSDMDDFCYSGVG